MHIESIIENALVKDESAVWRLEEHANFAYSDGAASERYLRRVFGRTQDLGSRSTELERYIKDWPSEYHLSVKRAQLLSGFEFNRSLSVLEVGCGCGAITRYLGEHFAHVVSVEGNVNRASLARARTRDLDSVTIVCAPFQSLRFSCKFDIIFCVGVFEYSAAFIEGSDAYDAALHYFSNILAPNGVLVIAIENQFGLKYFASAREDHLGVMFEGIEGYHRHPGKVRTFGKPELTSRLQKYFPHIEYYYPYPDYKIPDCVLSHSFLMSGRAGELIAHMRSRDYSGGARVFWDEMPAKLELNRNRMLDFFADSFLVFAGRAQLQGFRFPQLGIIYSSGRKPRYRTETRVLSGVGDAIRVEKRRIPNTVSAEEGEEPITFAETNSAWVEDGLSILTLVMLNAYSARLSLADIFAPSKAWLALLKSEAQWAKNELWLDGGHIDSIWGNAYLVGSECRIIDREWIWHGPIRLNSLLIRAIYDFLCRIETGKGWARSLRTWRGSAQIGAIARILGVNVEPSDFDDFVRIESRLSECVSGVPASVGATRIRWFLAHRPTRRAFRQLKPTVRDVMSRIEARLPISWPLPLRRSDF